MLNHVLIEQYEKSAGEGEVVYNEYFEKQNCKNPNFEKS